MDGARIIGLRMTVVPFHIEFFLLKSLQIIYKILKTLFRSVYAAHLLLLSLIRRENRHMSRKRLQTNACENYPRSPSYVQLFTLTH
jgi:hypothetical protein